ncbi:zinc-binding alcohol dehydrogenase [Orrella daihaiensis]|uniref:Zinc-binding alcohol dehydrogenase n=1 Tax=Orrella daihaiensis TaxID=2782176 RepID=A0ABY4AMM1_9BURK|nr:zinc-binding alcohol dehydrogenase [Orrella daihaiensis]
MRPANLSTLAADHCRIDTIFSAVSRGTESLIYNGEVPDSEFDRMAAPLMGGQLPFPVAYGYCNVGRVTDGPSDWLQKTVFSLGPHQTVFDAPVAMLAEVPANVPASRAVLAANMETALNAVWTGKPGPADRVAIIGGGVVGLLVAYLCSRMPGAEVALVDPVREREIICRELGIRYAANTTDLENCDVVFHASGHQSGLQDALSVAGNEACIVELSWYGNRTVTIELGGTFHSQQLRLQSCQVGHIEQTHQPRWSYNRRLRAALNLLADPRLDRLLEPAVNFHELPQQIPNILGPGQARLCQVIAYP